TIQTAPSFSIVPSPVKSGFSGAQRRVATQTVRRSSIDAVISWRNARRFVPDPRCLRLCSEGRRRSLSPPLGGAAVGGHQLAKSCQRRFEGATAVYSVHQTWDTAHAS